MGKDLTYYWNGIIDQVGRKLVPRYSRKRITLFRYTNALGDALFLTTLAREIKKRNPGAIIHVITGLPVIFERNPDIDILSAHDGKKNPGLGKYLIRYEHRFPWTQHLLNECARCVDIFNEIELRTYIYPSDEDHKWADEVVNQLGAPPVLVNRTAGPRTDKKNWPEKYWKELLPELVKNYPVVEIGAHSDNPIEFRSPNFTDLTGKTTLHQTAALIARAKLLICPITGLLHLASAFDSPVLCILGGSEPSHATKYRNTHFIENRPACADCYEKGPCLNDFVCLHQITPGMVLSKISEIVG